MSWTTDIDTTDLERVERPLPRVMPPIDLAPARSPFYISQVPTTALVSADAVRNFQSPQLPSYRITPPQPLTLAGSSTNATPTVSTPTFAAPQPPAPVISQTLKTNTTGYTFTFFQVRMPQNINPSAAISSYRIYRSLGLTTSGATVIQTITHGLTNDGSPIVVTDQMPNNNIRCYFVSAVNAAGRESTLTPAQSGFVQNNSALSATQQLATSFNNLPLNVNLFPTSSTTLSNNGGSPNITLASNTIQFGAGAVSYNSATIAPGTFGPNYIYAVDPQFQGGAAFYLQSSTPVFQAVDQVVAFGKIITASGSSTTGGGNSGGTTPNGGAARGIII